MVMGDFVKSFIRTMILGTVTLYFYVILGQYVTLLTENYNYNKFIVYIIFIFAYGILLKFVYLIFKKLWQKYGDS